MSEIFEYTPVFLSVVVGFCWIIYFFIAGKRMNESEAIIYKRHENKSWIGSALQVGGFICVLVSYRSPCSWLIGKNAIAEGLFFIFSAILCCLFTYLGLSATFAMGKQWNFGAKLASDHNLITTGPFGFVRHPIYTGIFGIMICTGIAMSTWIGLVVAVATFALGTAVRVRYEERLLKEAFGKKYESYQARVSAVIPLRYLISLVR